MTPPDGNARLTAWAVFLAPCAAVAIARLVGAAPASTHAATTPDPLPVIPDFQPPRQPEPRPDFGLLASPFFHTAGIQQPDTPAIAPVPAPARRPEPDPVFTLTAVMPHPTRPLAVLNGKPRTIGEAVAPGWILTALDGDARTATLTHASGRSVTVRIGPPG